MVTVTSSTMTGELVRVGNEITYGMDPTKGPYQTLLHSLIAVVPPSEPKEKSVAAEIKYAVGDYRNANNKTDAEGPRVTKQRRLHGVVVEEELNIGSHSASVYDYTDTLHAHIDGNVNVSPEYDYSDCTWWGAYSPADRGIIPLKGLNVMSVDSTVSSGTQLIYWHGAVGDVISINDYTLHGYMCNVSWRVSPGVQVALAVQGISFQRCRDGSWRPNYVGSAIPAPRITSNTDPQTIKSLCDAWFESSRSSWGVYQNYGSKAQAYYYWNCKTKGEGFDPEFLLSVLRGLCNSIKVDEYTSEIRLGCNTLSMTPEFLVAEAASSVPQSFSGNLIANTIDILSLREDINDLYVNLHTVARTVPNLRQPAKRAKSASAKRSKRERSVRNKALQSLSSEYLGVHYGVSLTLGDARDLARSKANLFREHKEHAHTQESGNFLDWNITTGYTIVFNPMAYPQYLMNEIAYQFDALLDRGNAWDLIPMSFIADWFVNIQDCLDALDKFDHVLQTYQVIAGIYTVKGVKTLKIDGVDGSLQLTVFNRTVSSTLPTPAIHLKSKDPRFQHSVEAGALLLGLI